MSNIFIADIVGAGTYAVPVDDATLTAATAGLDTLLGGIAGLSYDRVLAWVETMDGPGAPRKLSCLVEKFLWNGDECPSSTEIYDGAGNGLSEQIEATLLASAGPDFIFSVNYQQYNLFQAGAYYLWQRDAAGGFLYPNTITDDIAVGGYASPKGMWFQDGDLVLGTSAMSGTERLYVYDDIETGNSTGVLVEFTKDAAGAKGTYYGINNRVDYSGSDDMTSASAYTTTINLSSVQTIADWHGFRSNTRITNAGGAITTSYGFYRQLTQVDGTIATSYGIYLDSPATTAAGVITNSYGVYIASQDLSSTLHYGVYQAGSTDPNYFAGAVTVGTAGIEPSAGIELDSTTKALLVSRMTTVQRNALTAVDGMIIYDTDEAMLRERIAGEWMRSVVDGSADRTFYVRKSGSATGTGARNNPFLTIQAALDAVIATVYSATSCYVINIGPGIYSENLVYNGRNALVLVGPSPRGTVTIGPVSVAPAAGVPLTVTNSTSAGVTAYRVSGVYSDLVNQGNSGPQYFVSNNVYYSAPAAGTPNAIEFLGVKGDVSPTETGFLGNNGSIVSGYGSATAPGVGMYAKNSGFFYSMLNPNAQTITGYNSNFLGINRSFVGAINLSYDGASVDGKYSGMTGAQLQSDYSFQTGSAGITITGIKSLKVRHCVMETGTVRLDGNGVALSTSYFAGCQLGNVDLNSSAGALATISFDDTLIKGTFDAEGAVSFTANSCRFISTLVVAAGAGVVTLKQSEVVGTITDASLKIIYNRKDIQTQILVGSGYVYTQAVVPVEETVGWFTFDASQFLSKDIKFVATWDPTVTGVGNAYVRLYDMGPAAGPPGAPVEITAALPSTFAIQATASGLVYSVTAAFTRGAAGVGQITNAARMYAIRVYGSSTAGDTIILGSAGFLVAA
jgi:hypothetical protein